MISGLLQAGGHESKSSGHSETTSGSSGVFGFHFQMFRGQYPLWASSQTCFAADGFGEYGAGPFPTYNDLAAYFNMLRGISLHASPAINYPSIRIPDRFDASWPLVFTHGDLHLSNIRLGRDSKLYLIDWGLAGLYPQWFESWQMQYRLMIQAPYIPRSFVRFYLVYVWLVSKASSVHVVCRERRSLDAAGFLEVY